MKRRTAILTTLALVACGVGLSGCYERVVRAEGPGAGRYDVYEPSESDTYLDRAYDNLFGTDPKKKRR
ncbi:MAG: hypothetical protein RLN60_02450 [Phycisphaerales bacterium]